MSSAFSQSASKLPSTKPDTTSLPRILCLHGGGVNAAIFKAQSRALIRHLQHSFRLVWADAPFFCDPHPAVVGIYSDFAPFRRWLRWVPEQDEIDGEVCIEEIGYSMRTAMEDDDRAGGTGEWVGLMGFSQGAKLTASLLLDQQARETKAQKDGGDIAPGLIGIPGLNWRFGIILAGRAPLSNLNPSLLDSKALVSVGTVTVDDWVSVEVEEEVMLRKPTLHVHGTLDPGLHLHRILFDSYCKDDSKTLVEWEGDHRVPIKSMDVDRVVAAIYDLAESTGVKVLRTV